jgi:mono/diheme cytochrome c family protein
MDTFRSRFVRAACTAVSFGWLSLSAAGCSGTEPGLAGGDGGAAGAGGDIVGAGGVPGAGATPPAGEPSCVTYADDFGPRVHQPICGNCHGAKAGLPDFGVPAVARSACANIGNVVRRGIMPPDGSGYVLTPEQRTLVADWVALGCPETAAGAMGSCSSTPPAGSGGTTSTGGAPATGNAPGVNGSVVIDRAQWDPDKAELRIEGTASDAQATLTAEFTDRTETLQNDQGRFREEFTGVPVRPPSVTVTASSGASATAAVLAN